MLEVSKVSKIYTLNKSVIPVLKNVSFNLNAGDFIFLTGPSGAGKTTLLKLLILEEYPTLGEIKFEGVPIENLPQKMVPMYRRTLGVMFQDYKLLEHKTVYENIAFVLEILNKPQKEIKETVNKLLELVHLQDRANLFPKQLSGGEKRRVVIARAIANNPKLLIADEPTGDLDSENTDHIIDILVKINKAGTSILMTTHNLELLERYPSFRKWKIQDGELITEHKNTDDNALSKLQKHLEPETIAKLSMLGTVSEKDLLSLTPNFMKNVLKMSDKEISEFVGKLKTIIS